MENCMKRRDRDTCNLSEDEEDSDLEGDLQSYLLPGERSRRHDCRECGLISPYKRLRVEDLVRTSTKWESGGEEEEEESRNLLKFHVEVHSEELANTDALNDYNTDGHKEICWPKRSPSRSSDMQHPDSDHTTDILKSRPLLQTDNSLPGTSRGNVHKSVDDHDQLKLSAIVSKADVLNSNGADGSCGSTTSSSLKQVDPVMIFTQPSGKGCGIPYIDEICMEENPYSSPEDEYIAQPAFGHRKIPMPPPAFKAVDSLLLASYHPDFQESSQAAYDSDVDTSELKSGSMSSHCKKTLQDNMPRNSLAPAHSARCPETVELLEVHAGDLECSADTCPLSNLQANENMSDNKEATAGDDTDHYHTIGDMDTVGVIPFSKQSEPISISGPVNIFSGSCDSDLNEISNREPNCFPASHTKSVGTCCSSVSSPTKDALIGCDRSNMDGASNVDLDRSMADGCSSPVKLKLTASSGSTTGRHRDVESDNGQRLCSGGSRCLEPSFESRLHACGDPACDNPHQQQYELGRERQYSSGSSARSQPISAQGHHFEPLQVHLPVLGGKEYELCAEGVKNVALSSRSSRHSCEDDFQYRSLDRTRKQHPDGRPQQHSIQYPSARFLNHPQWCAQTEAYQTNKSYPSSLAISGDGTKRAVLQSSGNLRISIYWNVGLLTVHVIQARCLSSSWAPHCDSYVKMVLVPDESRRTRCKTQQQFNTNNPLFDEKFSMEILEEDRRKRLLISVWHKDSKSGVSEFLGCMSFGVGSLLKKDVDGWYYLLTEKVGKSKHLQSYSKPRPILSTRTYQNIPEINRAIGSQERIVITVSRGKNGFGFSFVDEFPPKVGRVDGASPAEHAGVKKGDFVIRINGQNVSRSTCEGVAHLVRKTNPQSLTLELLRDRSICTTTEITATGSLHPHHPSPYNKRGVGTSTDHLYESIVDGSSRDHHKENRAVGSVNGSYEDDCLTDDDSMACLQNRISSHPGITSTPRLFVAPWHKAASATQSHLLSKHESFHRLMSLELDYIDFMHFGMERYSRPLRHCILSAHQHMVIFQNVEKLVTISEYHIKQMQENNSSVNSDTDDSQSSESSMFPNSVALIYHSKIHMLGQAYEAYASGLAQSNALLRELRKNRDFMKFIREPESLDEQCQEHPSISAFINRPTVHIQELYTVLNEALSVTPTHSQDFATLQQIVIRLSQCVAVITGLSTAGRVQSLDSLTSSQGRTSSQTTNSDKGSMASLSSTCSSSEADFHRPLFPSSATSVRSLDKDMMRIQDILVFAPDVQDFQLAEEGRHFIHQGDVYRCRKGVWLKCQLILFSDLILIATDEPDGSLYVTESPIGIQDLAGVEINCKYASEFVLYINATATSSLPRRQQPLASCERMKRITLRAPSAQEKLMWKSLLEQRVAAFGGGRLQQFGSMKEISHVKTSIIL